MKSILSALALVLLITPAFAEEWAGDAYLSCMMGKGEVELRHGKTSDEALAAARAACDPLASADQTSPSVEGEDGDYVDYVIDAVSRSLKAVEDTEGIF